MGAFAAALQRRQFSRPDKNDLAAGLTDSNPSLSRQIKGMRNKDPGEVQQKALPVCIYRELHRISKLLPAENSHLDTAIAWLQTLAFFWCMRSCEYSDVQGDQRTKILCVRNFFDFSTKTIGTFHRIYTYSLRWPWFPLPSNSKSVKHEMILYPTNVPEIH
jgi:hypothetical protein